MKTYRVSFLIDGPDKEGLDIGEEFDFAAAVLDWNGIDSYNLRQSLGLRHRASVTIEETGQEGVTS